MAVVFESVSSGHLDNASSGSLAKPAGVVSGDALVFVGDIDGTAGFSTLTGFTDLFGGPVSGAGGTFRGGFQYRVCDGTEPVSYTISPVSGSERAAFALLRFSGVDNASPINASGTETPFDGASAFADFPFGVTTSVADCVVVGAICAESGNSGSPIVPTWPAGWTERYDNDNGPPGGGNASASCAAATFDKAIAGEIDNEFVGLSGGSTQWVTAYIALAPATASADALLANDVESGTEVSSPAVGQEHGLAATNVESTAELSAPALGLAHILAANGVEVASETSSPDVGQVQALVAHNIEAQTQVSTPTLSETLQQIERSPTGIAGLVDTRWRDRGDREGQRQCQAWEDARRTTLDRAFDSVFGEKPAAKTSADELQAARIASESRKLAGIEAGLNALTQHVDAMEAEIKQQQEDGDIETLLLVA